MKLLSRAAAVFATALPLAVFCIAGGRYSLLIAIAVAMHEAAHLLALFVLHGRVRSFRAAPFGFCIDYDGESLSLASEIAVNAAGCLANLIAAAASFAAYRLFGWDTVAFGTVSLVIACMNLLPLCPLDGFYLMQLFLSLLFLPDTALRISAALGYISSLAFFIFAAYLLITGVSGIYPLLFSVYIFSANAKFVVERADF